ncbi:hypothetical protein EYF80_025256 [Liparis tanakae]|uniref:Uncharacterized protein n=1 Tax=Liparis tanakae TaxID=230148 RepID=A0A4Z2HF57_9TELE|nr:hypothetical protein EYF80_025256 [Liparis tanakae]
MFTLSMTQEMTWSTCILVSHSVTCCNSWKSSAKMASSAVRGGSNMTEQVGRASGHAPKALFYPGSSLAEKH